MRRSYATLFLPLAAVAAPHDAIQNATVLTVTKGTIKNGSILIKDGKIAEVGEKVMVPQGAQVIDAGGQFVMPGIIDATRTSRRRASMRAAFRFVDGRH